MVEKRLAFSPDSSVDKLSTNICTILTKDVNNPAEINTHFQPVPFMSFMTLN